MCIYRLRGSQRAMRLELRSLNSTQLGKNYETNSFKQRYNTHYIYALFTAKFIGCHFAYQLLIYANYVSLFCLNNIII